MNILILIIGIVLFVVGIYLLHKASNIKIEKNTQAQTQQQFELKKIQQKIKVSNQYLQDCQQQIEKTNNKIKDLRIQYDNVNNQFQTNLFNFKQKLNNLYDNLKQESQSAYEHYEEVLDTAYTDKELEFDIKIEQLQNARQSVEKDLDQLKKVYDAAAAARLRQQEQSDKKRFYQLQISQSQIDDIRYLYNLMPNLHVPSVVPKLIWNTYIMKPASALCSRVLPRSSVCGIYKITNLQTQQVYVGQSVDIATRWKNHIKCGLGIDASSTNKLYNNMQEYGVWNFTFQLLQECSKDQLNEKECFWIELYHASEIGLNTLKGNKT